MRDSLEVPAHLPEASPALAKQQPDKRQIRPFAALVAFPAFRYLWASNLLFFTGAWTQTLVMGWLAYDLTGSTSLVGVYTAARLMPMLLGPIGGLIADRLDRVTFLLATQSFTFAVIVVTTLLTALGSIAYWQILVAGALLGLGQAPSQPARFTLVMDIVGRQSLANANALNSLALHSTMVIGPALGGVLLATIGTTGALCLSASWYIVAVLALIPLRKLGLARRVSSGDLNMLGDLYSSFRAALSNRNVRMVLFVSLAANLTVWPLYQGFMPVFAEEVFDAGVTGLSWSLASIGLGMMTGSLAIASLGDFRYKGGLFVAGTGLLGLAFAAFANAPSFPVALAFIFAGGLAAAAFGVLQSTLLLLVADESLRGRVMGIQVLTIGVLPLATLAQGFIAEASGLVTTATVAGGGLALAMLSLGTLASSFIRLR